MSFTPKTLLSHHPPLATAAADGPPVTPAGGSHGAAPRALERQALRTALSLAGGFLRAPLERVRLQQQSGEEGRTALQGSHGGSTSHEAGSGGGGGGGGGSGALRGAPSAALLLSQTLRDEGAGGPWRAFWPSTVSAVVGKLAKVRAVEKREGGREREERRGEETGQ